MFLASILQQVESVPPYVSCKTGDYVDYWAPSWLDPNLELFWPWPTTFFFGGPHFKTNPVIRVFGILLGHVKQCVPLGRMVVGLPRCHQIFEDTEKFGQPAAAPDLFAGDGMRMGPLTASQQLVVYPSMYTPSSIPNCVLAIEFVLG